MHRLSYPLPRREMKLHATPTEALLMADEGLRLMPYRCSAGKLTIGYGTTFPLTQEEAHLLLRHRLQGVVADLGHRFAWWPRLSPDRQSVLASMAYQMGMGGLIKFRRMLAAVERGDYEAAAREMLDSKWAKRDTPGRAGRLAERMRRG